MHKTTRRFRNAFDTLPIKARETAMVNFTLLEKNPHHPSLHFKKTGKFWSLRVGLHYRALAVKEKQDYIWVWIGNHDSYLKILKKEA